MRIVVDVNLSPAWVRFLEEAGWEAVHWSSVGDIRASDEEILSWARQHGYILFTHDLDFGILIALTRAEGPSVIQARTQDVLPAALGKKLINVLQTYKSLLEKGALVTIDERRARIRILPFS